MLVDVAPQTALPSLEPVGRKPPWNQPQVTLLALSRSPTLRPLTVTIPAFGFEQSSSCGSGSAITVPAAVMTSSSSFSSAGSAPCVFPATRLSAPGVDGPKLV